MLPNQDEFFMKRALALAKKGRGRVSPNPLVGCVIVRRGKIIAEGYHKKFGGLHAEIEALTKIQHRAKGATLYVTLEPCHHFGKTPPCVDAVIASGVTRVVVAMRDPNSLTYGKSLKKLRAARIMVTTGVLAAEAKELNRFFLKHITTGLPFVIAKVAQSLDGMITTKRGQQSWITGAAASQYVQNLRESVDAILVGRGTIAIDDPRLNVRRMRAPQPLRVVLDSKLALSPKAKIFSIPGGRILILTSNTADKNRARVLAKAGAEVVRLPHSKGKLSLRAALKILGERGIASVLVEGGAEIFSSFARERLADEWQFLIAPRAVGSVGLPAFNKKSELRFKMLKIEQIGDDILVRAQLP
jgi:diaminohydroxyphosphoribosylaminopyrimidine deaminase/5-amino-6-(5-phosphoribosylamino)uracil reductase